MYERQWPYFHRIRRNTTAGQWNNGDNNYRRNVTFIKHSPDAANPFNYIIISCEIGGWILLMHIHHFWAPSPYLISCKFHLDWDICAVRTWPENMVCVSHRMMEHSIPQFQMWDVFFCRCFLRFSDSHSKGNFLSGRAVITQVYAEKWFTWKWTYLKIRVHCDGTKKFIVK